MSSVILAKAIEWISYHKNLARQAELDNSISEINSDLWNENFMKVDRETCVGIMTAASYLSIESLLRHSYKTIANMLRNKTASEIREMFNIENDLEPGEEERIRNEMFYLMASCDKR